MPRPKRSKIVKDLTADFLSDRMDEDRAAGVQRFGRRSKFHQQNKTARTAQHRQDETTLAELDGLPVGRVIQVFSRFSEVIGPDGSSRLCEARKTLGKLSDTHVVVGDRVRYRDGAGLDAQGRPQGTIERIEPRDTILTRADSFKAQLNSPIVANAQQMLIVAAIVMPRVKWGLIDRMIIAARSGGLEPILCLNKIDLVDISIVVENEDHDEDEDEEEDELDESDDGELDLAPPLAAGAVDPEKAKEVLADARDKLAHYRTLGIHTIETSVSGNVGIDLVREQLNGKTTVLAGHSGVGKSSLVRAIEPSLDIRVREVSIANEKGKHTTTSARIYPLTGDGLSGEVIDTPGVKLFGLWQVTPDSLDAFFPDVENETAPEWRVESYERILKSLGSTR